MNYTNLCDTHTHTLYSRHAYSTIEENVRAAKEQGLELLASTDHYSAMLWPEPRDLKNYQYLSTTDMWPREWHGITLLHGCEADIVGLNGELFGYDIPTKESIVGDPYRLEKSLLERVTENLDYVIASVHGKSFLGDATPSQVTEMYIKALEHPKVFILGHIGRSGLSFDVDSVLLAAKSMNKLIEINEHSFSFREHSVDRCRHILERAMALSVPVSLATDAHISINIGRFYKIQSLLQELHFPEELIASRNKTVFLHQLKNAGVKDLTSLLPGTL